ncbi:MAG: hypothetical protein ABIK09_06615 [Pseudomonadota bacterium]
MNKRMVSIGLGILVAGGFVAARYFLFPELEIKARKAAGAGWTEAKPEIKGNISSALSEGFVDIDLKQGVLDQVATCVTDKVVEFLNSTDCDYYFNESTTTEAEHLAAQEACLKGVGYDAKEMEFTLACAKQHVPKDWNIMRPLLSREMDVALQGQILDAAKRKGAVDCVVGKTVELLGKTECAPLNQAAETAEQLFTPADECFENAGIKAEAEEAIGACITAAL